MKNFKEMTESAKNFIVNYRGTICWVTGITIGTVAATHIQQLKNAKFMKDHKEFGWVLDMLKLMPGENIAVWDGTIPDGTTISQMGEYIKTCVNGTTAKPESIVKGITMIIEN